MQQERSPVLVRQPRDGLIEYRPQITPDQVVGLFRRPGHGHLALAGTTPGFPRLGLEGRPGGDSVQPGAEGLRPLEGAGLAGEQGERDLEGILGRVPVVQDTQAGAQDQRAVPPDQGREGGLVVLLREAFQELGVGQGHREVGGGEVPDETKCGLNGCGRHSLAPVETILVSD
jgi:hypothetical protein